VDNQRDFLAELAKCMCVQAKVGLVEVGCQGDDLCCPCGVSGEAKASRVKGAEDTQDWILAAAEAVDRVDGV
jgi:hypothetical protein